MLQEKYTDELKELDQKNDLLKKEISNCQKRIKELEIENGIFFYEYHILSQFFYDKQKFQNISWIKKNK
jgi:hypothetical protein